METSPQPPPGDFVWEAPGSPVSVHISLEIIDRIAADVMRGFGAVPKRGAEVGGLLIGNIQPGDPALVRVEDYEPIECGYTRGPSYLFDLEDRAAFEEACQRWMPDASRSSYAVGYFRSHTREGLSLAPEDVDLMDRHFPAPEHVALLIKPYATKVSVGGFFARDGNAFQETTPLEFPFRRRELAGEEAPARRSLQERGPRRREPGNRVRTRVETPVLDDAYDRGPDPESAYAVTLPSKSRIRSVWIPLSFVFLLFGLALGFMVGIARNTTVADKSASFALGLTISKDGSNLIVKWDPQSAAVRKASRGVMEIEDGVQSPAPQKLDPASLQSGRLIYGNARGDVRFRF
ncbi:MAG TPA: hypothetical protein VGP79_11165, partial [Bryobacteraceae bacterium]|nr:hypothetical protein [Bryobacteraceae bacterium]